MAQGDQQPRAQGLSFFFRVGRKKGETLGTKLGPHEKVKHNASPLRVGHSQVQIKPFSLVVQEETLLDSVIFLTARNELGKSVA